MNSTQKQVGTNYAFGNKTESARCPFCNTVNIGQHPGYSAVRVCSHFRGFVEGHRRPTIMFQGPA